MEDFIRVKLPGTQERVSLYEITGIQPAALARDRSRGSADPSKQRYAGKTWTAVLNEDERRPMAASWWRWKLSTC